MVQLLVRALKDCTVTDRKSLLRELLEAKNDSGMTALLIASQNRDYAMAELLVLSGADVNAVDRYGNTAIFLIATSSAPDETPSKEQSPRIFKV